jgi:hypothetical protein
MDIVFMLLQAAGIGLTGPVGLAIMNPIVRRVCAAVIRAVAKKVHHEYTRPLTPQEQKHLDDTLAYRRSPAGQYDRIHGLR